MEPKDCVAGQDVPVDILQKKILSAKSAEDKARFEKELEELMRARELVRESMHQIVEKCVDSQKHAQVWNGRSSAYCSKAYKEVVEYFRASCFDWHDQKYQSALKYMYLFANLLEEKVPVERIKGAVDEVSASLKMESVTPTNAENK